MPNHNKHNQILTLVHAYSDLAYAYSDLAHAYSDLAQAYSDLAHAILIWLTLF